MVTINLRDFFYWYTSDEPVEVSEAVAESLRTDRRYESAHWRRMRRNKADHSLDTEEGLEYGACLSEPTPEEILERMEDFGRLCHVLNSLPPAQGRRIEACIILGKSYLEVAEAEGVNESAVRKTVERGLQSMRKLF